MSAENSPPLQGRCAGRERVEHRRPAAFPRGAPATAEKEQGKRIEKLRIEKEIYIHIWIDRKDEKTDRKIKSEKSIKVIIWKRRSH